MGVTRKIPKRQCIGCQEMKEKRDMIRVVKTSEGEITVDATGKKNGRGAYICPSKDCMQKAIKSRGLERAFKTSIPTEVYDRLMEEIEDIETE